MKKILQWVSGILLLAFSVWVVYDTVYHKNDLLKNGVLVNVKITKFFSGIHGSRDAFECHFDYCGQPHETTSGTTYNSDVHALIGKTFPAMFSQKSGFFQVLITPEDFEKFKMPYPDSLKWVGR